MSELNEIFKIVDYLNFKGEIPFKKLTNEWLYFSPIKVELTPSFFVNPTKNRFNDFSSGAKGDVFRLVQIMEKVDFKQALEILKGIKETNVFSFSGNSDLKATKLSINEVRPISRTILKNYILSRGISLKIAYQYLFEIHYSVNSKNWFGIGFKNNSGGYEIRAVSDFKTKTKNDITTIKGNSKNVSVFEGFFDFLSALEYYRIEKSNNDIIVLNSVSNIEKLIEALPEYNKIYSFLDNDKAGKMAFDKIASKGFNVSNESIKLYPNHKDFNDFILNKPII